MPADRILENARVHTLDAGATIAEAVAISSGRIVAVGTRRSVEDEVSPSAERIDLGGRTVVPGFIDSHTHFQKAAMARMFSIDFLELRPVELSEIFDHVRAAIATRPEGAWIRGDALDPRKLRERRYPTRWELDAVAPDHAIVLIGVGNHTIAANSLALSRAGIDRTTEDPPGGRLDRDENGEVTGVLRELGKLRLDPNRPDTVLPGPSAEDRLEAVSAGFRHLHQAGVTSIHDIVMDPAEIRAYMRLREDGRLAARVRFLVRGYEAKTSLDQVIGLGLEPGFGDEWLQYSGIKLSIDGACGERNAATYEPYPGEPDNTGLIRIPQDLLDELVARCHSARQRVAIHAIGPRAVDMALTAYERAFETTPRGTLRHRIEHAYLPPTPGQLERLAAAGIIVSTQPSFFWDGDGWTDIWDVERLANVLPLRAMLDAGVQVTGGTDYPCVPVEPLPGLGSMVSRRSMDGTILDRSQAITPLEALRLQTSAAAYAGYDERLLGSVEVGKAADLVVLSADPLAVDPEEIGSIRAEMTLLAGDIVFTIPS
jgi:predicted amidohydrolase YtcJ